MVHEVAVVVIAVLLLLDKASSEYNHVIYVNGSTGQNSKDCLTSNSASFPCDDLDWVFQQPEAHLNSTHYVISEGTYNLTQPPLPFQDLNSLAFTGSGSIVMCTQPETGLAFINVVNITFYHISFFYCAAVGNSKSKNIKDYTISHIQIGLFFYLCESISMEYVSVSHSPNATGVAVYGTNGINSFTHCNFSNNTLDKATKTEREIYPGGGGVLVDVTSCKPDKLSCQSKNARFVGTIYTFLSCSFEANRAGNIGDEGFSFPYNIEHNGVGCGGGLSLYIRGNASEITFEVENSTFENNVALWGGGLFVELIDNSHGNLITIKKTYFRGNSCPHTSRSETAGGAIRFSQFLTLYGIDIPISPDSMRNELSIDNCTFVDNWALKGGGISVTWPLENTSKDKAAVILISKSIFNINVAKLGAAIFMEQFWKTSRRQGILAEIGVRNCLFDNNTDRYYTKFPKGRTEPVEIGIGTVYVYFCVVNFYENVIFTNNYGTALAVSDGNVIFDGCYANFFNNRGNTGGAITLLGASTFNVGRGTEMMFENNIATTHGGAIHAVYISRQNLLSDATCFIRHIDPSLKPDDWNISMTFHNNTDHGGVAPNAIYATSILPCTMVGTIGAVVDKNKIFCWKGWHYSNNISSSTSLNGTSCHTYIETNVGQIQYVGHEVDGNNYVKAFPGWEFEMPLLTTDDYGKDLGKYTIYSLRYNYSYNSFNSSYAWGDSTSITVPENTIVDVTAETIGQRTWFLNFYVDLQPCPPGFVISKGANATKLCQCANSYRGEVTCIEKAREAKIIKNVWMGLYNSTYYTVICPNRYCRKHTQRYIKLPNNSLSLNNDICAHNRKGLICGECRDDYGPAINSPTYDCVQCTNITLASNIAKYIASVYLPLSFLFTILIVFDIRLTTGPANAFILYCQVITSTFSLDADGGIPLDQLTNNLTDKLIEAYKVPYGIFNLIFIENHIPSICFSSGFNTMDILLLQYGVAFFPLLMIVIIVICLKIKEIFWRHRNRHSENACSRFLESKLNKVNNALLPAFSAFLLLTYTKVSITSSYLMSTAYLRDENGSTIEPVRLYLAGQYSKSNVQYYYYFVPALIIFSTFVALTPLLLLDFPLRALEWLISKSACLRNIYPAGKIHILLDTFHGCYKKNMRFFAGFYFLCRLIINLSHVYCSTWLDQFVIQQLITTVLIALVALFRPYQKKFINYVDMLIFTNLAILNCLSLYLYVFYKMNPLEDGGSLVVIFIVQYFLIFLPALYMIAYILWQWRSLRNAVLKFIIVVINHFASSSSPRYQQLYSVLIMNIDDPALVASGRWYKKIDDLSEPQNNMEALLKRAEEENKYKQANLATIMEVNEERWERWEEEARLHHVSGSTDSNTTSTPSSGESLFGSVRYGPEGSSIHSNKLI